MFGILWRAAEWLGILVYAALVYEMLRLWIAPEPDDVSRILTLAVMMGFEFILVHSGVFMAAMPRKISLLVFVPFYGVFALAMNAIVPGNEILWLYMGVVLLRMRFAFSNPTSEARQKAALMSIAAVMTYFILIFVFAFGSGFIPDLGLSQEFLEQTGYHQLHDSGGIFIDMPKVPLAMGAVYFTVLAVWEYLIFWKFKPQWSPDDEPIL